MVQHSIDPELCSEIVKFCIDRKALMFGDFTLKGGRKSPCFSTSS
ncbi:MAG TPA: hypothetical protein VKK79_15270 [Candidatus Lokiarchaeia archaeon]|nr:hypothetical protein [Candidatus Lokiarchaeia archaeon]